VRSFGGRLVKTTGDGVLLEFPSVVAAVECAIVIQKMMAERNAALPEAKRILYRVGVNLGDILIDGDDILGDGVNVAARLEGICEPGAVCLSEDAYRQARGRIEAEFVDLGEQALKNIAQPVRAYALTPATIASAVASSSSGTTGKGEGPSVLIARMSTRPSRLSLPSSQATASAKARWMSSPIMRMLPPLRFVQSGSWRATRHLLIRARGASGKVARGGHVTSSGSRPTV
jgi:hypothetical protein